MLLEYNYQFQNTSSTIQPTTPHNGSDSYGKRKTIIYLRYF